MYSFKQYQLRGTMVSKLVGYQNDECVIYYLLYLLTTSWSGLQGRIGRSLSLEALYTDLWETNASRERFVGKVQDLQVTRSIRERLFVHFERHN